MGSSAIAGVACRPKLRPRPRQGEGRTLTQLLRSTDEAHTSDPAAILLKSEDTLHDFVVED